MTKIIFYQSHFSPIGGVETFAYNWCFWLRNYFDIKVLYCNADGERLRKMKSLVDCEKFDKNKEYECDILFRNSVWGEIPTNIKYKRAIEMRHADYKYLSSIGQLNKQYHDMGIKEIVACGEYVGKMSNEVLHDNPKVIKNILLPRKKTNKILGLISCTRIDAHKGWNRMLKLMDMMKRAGIKFEWNIFTNNPQFCPYEEVHFYKARADIWDYIADADYCVLLSDSEGLSYTIQEALLYQVPCIVTDVGGCAELIKDGVNGYVVPLDMNFDIKKIVNIPKCEEYDNHALEDWLEYLGYKGKVNKEEIIKKYEEEKEMKAEVKAIRNFRDVETNDQRVANVSVWITSKERAEYLKDNGGVEILRYIEEPKINVEIKPEIVVDGKKVTEAIKKATRKTTKKTTK